MNNECKKKNKITEKRKNGRCEHICIHLYTNQVSARHPSDALLLPQMQHQFGLGVRLKRLGRLGLRVTESKGGSGAYFDGEGGIGRD